MAMGFFWHSSTTFMGTVVLVATSCAAAALLAGCKTSPYAYSVDPYEYPGVRLYQVFCSSCHGLTGRGDGPVEPLLRSGAPDLTKISARNGGKFPRDRVHAVVDGREAYRAHGTSQMPVWGFEFNSGGNDTAANRRIDRMVDRLTSYLESLQFGGED